MGFIIYNSNGSVASSSGSSGGGNAGGGKSLVGPFTFWSPQNDCPTIYNNMQYPLVGWNNGSVATMNAGLKVASAGYVSSLVTLVNGPTNGNAVNMQFYKNGAASGLLTTTTGVNGNTAPNSQPGGSNYSFVAGDVLSVYIQASASGINQSFSAFLELVLS